MSKFTPSTTLPGRRPPLTEMSPLFHVMQNIQYQYTEIQDPDEEVEAGRKSTSVSPTNKTKTSFFLNRNGWFTQKPDAASRNDSMDSKHSPHMGLLFTAIVICVVLGLAFTSLSSTVSPSVAPPSGIPDKETIISSKMTLIPVETKGNARSVKVVTTSGSKELTLATGVYITNYENNGWNHLRVHMPTVPLTNDRDYFTQYFMGWEAMGFLEGFVTCEEMQRFYVNIYHGLFDGGDIVPGAVQFLVENYAWVHAQAEANWRVSEYWLAVKSTLVQLNGMLSGLRQGCPTAAGGSSEWDIYSSTSLRSLHDMPTLVNLLVLNANGDLYQIAAKYNQQSAPPAKDDDYQYTNPPPPTNSSTFFDDDTVKASATTWPGPVSPRRMFDAHLERIKGQRSRSVPDVESDNRDLAEATTAKISPDETGFSARERQHIGSDHCSAFIRLLPDYSDVVFAHNTWDDFQNAAPRIFKEYSFPQPHYRRAQGVTTPISDENQPNGGGNGGNINNGEDSSTSRRTRQLDSSLIVDQPDSEEEEEAFFGSKKGSPSAAPSTIPNSQTYSVLSSTMVNIHFSSSPGFLSSVDDFYTISGNGNMAVIETSLDIYDQTLLTQIHYDSVLSWIRVRVANQYAQSGEQWSRLFALYHSGTYVNQWLVVDFAKFTPNVKPEEDTGLLTVLEEMPGYIFWEDVTDILVEQGYWASFNDAYFDVVRQVSGAQLMCEESSNYCYQSDPRNMIFKQRAPLVSSIDEAKALIRYNNWEYDPIARNDSCLGSISCRMDLQPLYVNQYPFGALDAKLSSILLSSRLHYKTTDIATSANLTVVATGNGDESPVTGQAGPSSSATANFLPKIWTIMGPTHDQQPVFCWSNFDDRRDLRGKKFSHIGAPSCYDYDWIVFPPPKNYINNVHANSAN